MNKHVRSLIDPNAGVYLAVLCLFDVVSIVLGFFLFGMETEAGRVFLLLATVETIVIILLAIYFLITISGKQKQLASYIESVAYDSESARSNTIYSFPLPMVVFSVVDSRIIWANGTFFQICGRESFRMDASITDLVPEFSAAWLSQGEKQYSQLLELNGKKYRVQGTLIQPETGAEPTEFLACTYWIDMTEADEIRREYEQSRPVSAVIVIDNYEELIKNRSDRERNNLRDNIEDRLSAWATKYRGFIRRYDRDRYIAFFEQRDLERMKEEKFSIVQEMHNVIGPTGIEASLSIGLGQDAESFGEALQYADLSTELALSRGGDQTVIKNRLSFDFFGGRGSEVEKRTKVKSRVMANTLKELIKDSSKVFIMGHKYADLDAIGAAIGVCCLARQCDVRAYIIVDENNNASEQLISDMKKIPEYQYVFMDTQDAVFHADIHTLLVVVDTNRPEQVEDRELLEACNRVAVIDHHRVGATYISNTTLGFIEPYASSSCELITEILQEVADQSNILKCEAEAILSGIVLDTKNFMLRTGERTFDAAAFLRHLGAETSSVKKLLQSGIEDTIAKYQILERAKLYRSIAIAIPDGSQNRIVAAKAADELLNISGVEASVVLAKNAEGNVFASARSIGELNVQILMEKLGGGGNRSAAAVQFQDVGLDDAEKKLLQAIDEYFETD